MASFLRKLFGSGSGNSPQQGLKDLQAGKKTPTGDLRKSAQALGSSASGTTSSKNKYRTNFTGPSGISASEKSGIALKTLTGA